MADLFIHAGGQKEGADGHSMDVEQTVLHNGTEVLPGWAC